MSVFTPGAPSVLQKRGGFVPGSGFSPASVAGLALWLDASDAATITTATGVSSWADKSGGGRTATQATGSAQPTVQTAAQNGKNTLRFTEASSQFLTLSSALNVSATGYTIFAVMRRGGPASANKVEVLGSSVNTTVLALEWWTTGVLYSHGVGGASRGQFSTAQASTTYNTVAAVCPPAADGKIYFNGADISSTPYATATMTTLDRIGYSGANYCNGEIAEILLYNTNLSDPNRQSLEAWLKAKWATP